MVECVVVLKIYKSIFDPDLFVCFVVDLSLNLQHGGKPKRSKTNKQR